MDAFYRKYQVLDEIGKGRFGTVKRAIIQEGKKEVAIKFDNKRSSQRQVLLAEADALRHLQGGPGIPKMYSSGTVDGFSYLVMELLGDNLSVLRKAKDPRLSAYSVALLAEQMLTTMEFIHSRGYLHRDVKPQNFCMGQGDSETLYILDFGLTTKFMDERLGIHAPYRENRSFMGTASFASLNAHMGVQQSRRDDLESMLLVLIFLMKGKLPWQAQRYKTKVDKQIQIRMQKMLITTEELCEGLPFNFASAFSYVRMLSYDEKPDYDKLRAEFRSISKAESLALAFAALPPEARMKRSYKVERALLKHSIGRTAVAPEKCLIRLRRWQTSRLPSCPPVQKPKPDEAEPLSPVRGHKIRSQSVGILPDQPSISSESSHEAWAPVDDMSSTLKCEPVLPLNLRLLLARRM